MMARYLHGVIEKGRFISPSQEDELEKLGGWRAPGVIDETPSQPANVENSSQNSRDRVFDVTGSSLCSGASQDAVEWVSPDLSSQRTASDPALREVDSYNEAFESDRSQSPSGTLSWSLPADPSGYNKDPKSPISATVLAKETEALLFNFELMKEVESSERLHVPPAAGDTSEVRTELPVGKAPVAEGNAEESSGRGEGSAVCKADAGGAAQARADIEGCPAEDCSNGVRADPPRESPAAGEVPALKPSPLGDDSGSEIASAFPSLRRNEKDCQTPFSGERASTFGIERDGCALSAANAVVQDSLDQIANSVQVKMQVLDNMVVDDDQSLKEPKSGDSCKRRRCAVQHELDGLETVAERGIGVEMEFTTSTTVRDELETSIAAVDVQAGHRAEVSSGAEQSKEPLSTPAPSKFPTDVAEQDYVDKPGATTVASASEDAGQRCPSMPSRPPRAVQEKLHKLRSQSGNKTAHSDGLDLLRDRLRKERDNISARTVLEAIKLRSGERPPGEITAADLLRTALDVGITLPPPFHRNYFSG